MDYCKRKILKCAMLYVWKTDKTQSGVHTPLYPLYIGTFSRKKSKTVLIKLNM